MHRRPCLLMCRTVLDVPTKTLTSLAFPHFQFSFCLLRGRVIVGLLVFLRSYFSSRSLFRTVVAKPLSADYFSSVVNIDFTRVSGSGIDPSVSSTFFRSSVKRWHQKNTCSASSVLRTPRGTVVPPRARTVEGRPYSIRDLKASESGNN